jgi:hypothetical protein
MGPIHALLDCIIRIILLLYHYYTYYFRIRNGVWVRIHCIKLANQHIYHRGLVSIQTKSIRDSIINLQQALLNAVSFRNRPTQIGLSDVRQPCRTQSRLELSTQ